MDHSDQQQGVDMSSGSARRIIVDNSIAPPREIRSRRLESPPYPEAQQSPATDRKKRFVRWWAGLAALGAAIILIVVLVSIASRMADRGAPGSTTAARQPDSVVAVPAPQPATQESTRIEEDAKQVIRRISRDNKPYSFSEETIGDIQARVNELSRMPQVGASLTKLQGQTNLVASKAVAEGLQPSLVILVALALTKGGEGGDSLATAARVLPQLSSLNKTFGSIDADSSLILIAAFREGPGTRRSHPLLRRINRVVNNPVTERNVWYLHDQNVVAQDAYDLVVDTIAFGIIARNPRQFGLDSDPLSL